jgi:hypothetical protein
MLVLEKLRINNRVLYQDVDFNFSDGVTLITGCNLDAKKERSNASGKSLLLGGLHVFIGKKDTTDFSIHYSKDDVNYIYHNNPPKLLKGEENMDFPTKTKVLDYLSFVSEDVFKNFLYLENKVPFSIIKSTGMAKKKFFIDIFDLTNIQNAGEKLKVIHKKYKEKDTEYKYINTELNGIVLDDLYFDIEHYNDQLEKYEAYKNDLYLYERQERLGLRDIVSVARTLDFSRYDEYKKLYEQQQKYDEYFKAKEHNDRIKSGLKYPELSLDELQDKLEETIHIRNRLEQNKRDLDRYKDRLDRYRDYINNKPDISKSELRLKISELSTEIKHLSYASSGITMCSKCGSPIKSTPDDALRLSRLRDKLSKYTKLLDNYPDKVSEPEPVDKLKINTNYTVKFLRDDISLQSDLIKLDECANPNFDTTKFKNLEKYYSYRDYELVDKPKFDVDSFQKLEKEYHDYLAKLAVNKDRKKRKKELKLRLKKLYKYTKDIGLINTLSHFLSNKGVVTFYVKSYVDYFISQLNVNTRLLFDYDITFRGNITVNKVDIEYNNGKGWSDIYNLSGAESNCFWLLFLLVYRTIFPLTNFVILDEIIANLDPKGKQLFCDRFLPVLSSVVPSVIVITPDDLNVPNSRNIKVIRKNNKSSLEVGYNE